MQQYAKGQAKPKNDLQRQNDLLLKNLVRWKCRYRGIKKFLLEKGVPAEYFDEYNARFGDGESKTKV